MDKNFDIIMFTNSRGLGTSSITDEHRYPFIYTLADEMKKTGKLLIIPNIVPAVLSPLKYFSMSNKKDPGEAYRRSEENLYICNISSLLPLRLIDTNFPWSPMFHKNIRHTIKRAMDDLNINSNRKKITWFTHPLHMNYFNMAGGDVTVYECYDDYSLQGRKKRDVFTLTKEEELAKSVDIIFATSQSLTERLLKSNSNTYYFPNACDYEMFREARNPDTPIPEKLKSLPGPIIGFMGNLFNWYDYDLLENVISLKNDWTFIFIGEIHSNARKRCQNLWRHPNARHLGWQNFLELPSFLKGFDAAIMPYKVDALTHTVNPNKMWHYMAAGVPIAATPIAEVMRFKDIIEIGGDVPSFIHAVEKALKKKNDAGFIKKMTQIAQTASWGARTKFVLDLIDKNLGRN